MAKIRTTFSSQYAGRQSKHHNLIHRLYTSFYKLIAPDGSVVFIPHVAAHFIMSASYLPVKLQDLKYQPTFAPDQRHTHPCSDSELFI